MGAEVAKMSITDGDSFMKNGRIEVTSRLRNQLKETMTICSVKS